jgi:L-ascorbate metabolism protein UlaG (beta-lactamase superfamily)
METNIRLRWLGNAGLQFGNKEILVVDPFLSRPVMGEFLFSTLETNSALQKTILPECDYILITHAHYDHM